MRHAELVARLDASAERLTTRVLAEMYADPFWHARFGERADRYGRQDGRFHVDYVIQALQADDVGIIEHYARWLQQVLTSRGMCTRHLAENFARLADAIRDEAWPDGFARHAVWLAGFLASRASVGALLRREGLHSSYLTAWWRERDEGERAADRARRTPDQRACAYFCEVADGIGAPGGVARVTNRSDGGRCCTRYLPR